MVRTGYLTPSQRSEGFLDRYVDRYFDRFLRYVASWKRPRFPVFLVTRTARNFSLLKPFQQEKTFEDLIRMISLGLDKEVVSTLLSSSHPSLTATQIAILYHEAMAHRMKNVTQLLEETYINEIFKFQKSRYSPVEQS